jgi:hypothetical protein
MEFEKLVEVVENRGDQFEEYQRDWKEYIIRGNVINPIDLGIKNSYLFLARRSKQKAEEWLNQMARIESRKLLGMRSKIEGGMKIYSKGGIDVYIDSYTHKSFLKTVKKMNSLKRSVDLTLDYIKDILPNRKPKIVITDAYENPHFVNVDGVTAPAIYIDRIIYIDQDNVDNYKYFVHEIAHFVADLIPKQTEPLLKKAYKDMLDIYWKSAKIKKRKLDAGNNASREDEMEAERWRRSISSKLGFPEYGLKNFDEFFAVLIENWKTLPVNSATYKFKTLVKNVLIRL